LRLTAWLIVDRSELGLTTDKILWAIVEPLLVIHEGLCRQSSKLDRTVGAMARRSPIAKRLMTVSGVGIVTALTFMAVIDTPARFRRSSDAAAYIGLTPRRYQSGQVDYSGRISRSGNSELRLYEAGCAVLNRTKKFSALKSWGLRLAARKGFRKAAVAVARKIAVIMHRIWSDGTVFQWTSRKGDVAVA
jgi:transposase